MSTFWTVLAYITSVTDGQTDRQDGIALAIACVNSVSQTTADEQTNEQLFTSSLSLSLSSLLSSPSDVVRHRSLHCRRRNRNDCFTITNSETRMYQKICLPLAAKFTWRTAQLSLKFIRLEESCRRRHKHELKFMKIFRLDIRKFTSTSLQFRNRRTDRRTKSRTDAAPWSSSAT